MYNPEAAVRVPLWNWVPRNIPSVVLEPYFQHGTLIGPSGQLSPSRPSLFELGKLPPCDVSSCCLTALQEQLPVFCSAPPGAARLPRTNSGEFRNSLGRDVQGRAALPGSRNPMWEFEIPNIRGPSTNPIGYYKDIHKQDPLTCRDSHVAVRSRAKFSFFWFNATV